MRKMYSHVHGTEVDLDDPKTFEYLPNDSRKLFSMMFEKIGYALVYMNYFPDRKENYNENLEGGQRARVEGLIRKFAENTEKYYSDDIMWWKEQVFLLEDETENMC